MTEPADRLTDGFDVVLKRHHVRTVALSMLAIGFSALAFAWLVVPVAAVYARLP